MTYSEKLKDPRWQKKRLEVLEAAGWECEHCSVTSKTLNVHHGRYDKGKDPWEYDTRSLHVLCDGCHAERHIMEAAIKLWMSRMEWEELRALATAANGLVCLPAASIEFPYYPCTERIRRVLSDLLPCMDFDHSGDLNLTEVV